jgi:translation initiation factor IF-3
MYTIKGEVKVIKEVRQVSDTFKVREFVITDDSGQYPQIISFQSAQDKCDILNNFKVGDKVEVFFNLQGREWTSPKGDVRVFNTLDAWKINSQVPNAIKEDAPTESNDSSGLPF